MKTATSIASRLKWPLAAVGVFALLATGWWAWRRQSQPPLDLLARAYTSRRLLEYRIPGARYAPLSTQRGDRRPDSAPELLQSQLRIIPALFKAGNQGGWFHAKGRAELIELKFDEAIRSLQTANDLGEDSANFWTDFGSAYAGRAAMPNAAIDYTKAIELFSTALQKDSQNSAALYNRALAENSLSLMTGAIRDLELLTRVEADSGWLEITKAQLRETRKRRDLAFGRAHEELKQPDETEFEAFIQHWSPERPLPSAVSLGIRLEGSHQDVWVTQAIAAVNDQQTRRAVRALVLLEQMRRKFQLEDYEKALPETAWVRRVTLPVPLAAWRDFEFLSRVSAGLDAGRCEPLEAVVQASESAGFRWFAVQSALEFSTCQAGQGELDAANRSIGRAHQLARDGHYGTAEVRARGFSVTRLGDEGRYRESVEIIRPTLETIMAGEYTLTRAHQFYLSLWQTSQRLGRWQTAHDAMVMAVEVAQRVDLKRLEMLGRILLAECDWHLGDKAGSRTELVAADRIGDALPPDETVSIYRATAQAQARALDGDDTAAAAVDGPVLAKHNLFLDAPYLVFRASLELNRSRPENARRFASEALRRIVAQPGEARRFHKEDVEATTVLVKALVDLHDFQGALAAWRLSVRRSRELRAPEPALASSPASGELRVAIVPLGDTLGLFTEDERGVRFEPAHITVAEGLALLRRLRALCATPLSDPREIYSASRNLWAGLWGSTSTGPSSGSIRLEAEGEWAAVPWLAILDGRAPVLAEYAVPGGPKQTSCSGFAGQMALVQADRIDTEIGIGLPPLPFLGEERNAISMAVPGVYTILGNDAVLGALTGAAHDYRWFHFSGHAVRWRQRTVLAGAPNRRGSSEEERRGFWNLGKNSQFCSELVFLAACSTAATDETESIGPEQLAGAAILGGARYAIAALWDVDSAATSVLSAAFYRALGDGLNPAAALRQATSRLRSAPQYRHPYYWAPFVVFEAS